MNNLPSPVQTLIRYLIVVSVPVALVMMMVRLLMTPAFPEVEYRMPGFPNDPYGFTMDERLEYSKIAIEYLLNDEGIEFLGDLTFEDGRPLYNQRELKHMVDVKVVTQAALQVWYVSLVILFGMGIWAKQRDWWDVYKAALVQGSWLTVVLLGAIVLFVLAAFGVAFVWFHEIFFEAGTWTFLYSDTLIRLFPERFWQDCFLYIGGGAILAAALIIWLVKARSETESA
jgi:integral membrane protein (TIGR01906 family)